MENLKDKIQIINKQRKALNKFRMRIKYFLISLDAYSINKQTNDIKSILYNDIKQNKKISLDELVKRHKINKHKIIEILNDLIKKKLIKKYFDKGFYYE